MKKILVTGSAGFIGSWVAERLHADGYEVVGIDNFNGYYDPQLKRDRAKRIAPKVNVIEGDIADYAAVDRLFSEHRFTAVCHLAAQPGVRYSIDHPFAYETANNIGMLNVLELCRRHGVPSLVYASSSSVYGGNTKLPFSEDDRVDGPISLYAATKRYNELLAHTYHHLYGIRCTGLRLFTVYGPWGRPDMAIFRFTESIFRGRPIDVFNRGKMRRDFTYVTDIVDGVISAIEKDLDNEIINLGNATPVPLTDFIGALERAIGRSAQRVEKPMQPGDVVDTEADISKASRLLGYDPKVDFEPGVARFVEWYRDYYKMK